MPISLILFDNIDLAKKSENNPLKILNSLLDYYFDEENKSFIEISNYTLYIDKINNAINLCVTNLENRINELIMTSSSIVQNISENLSGHKIIEILSGAYYEYKKILKFIKNLTILKQYKEQNGIKIDIIKAWFTEIKKEKEFKNLMKEEKYIIFNFNSNQNFFNYIKGIPIDIQKLNYYDDELVFNYK